MREGESSDVMFLSHRQVAGVRSYSSVGQSVRLITVRSAVQARVGAFFVALLRDVKKSKVEELCYGNGSMAEWSKAPALGAGPKGRGFEPHCCQTSFFGQQVGDSELVRGSDVEGLVV